MARGRRQDPTLPPSRQLLTQRAFRDRKAAHVRGLEEAVKTLGAENQALRQRLEEQQQQQAGECASCRDARERRRSVAGGMARVDLHLVTLAHAMSNLHAAIGHASNELLADGAEGGGGGSSSSSSSGAAARHAYDAGAPMFGGNSSWQMPVAGPSSGMVMPGPSAWGTRPSSSSGARARAPGYAELASGQGSSSSGSGSRKRTSSDFASLFESPLGAAPPHLAAADAAPTFSPHLGVGAALPLAGRRHGDHAASSHGEPYLRPGSSGGASSSPPAPAANVQQFLAMMRAGGERHGSVHGGGDNGQQPQRPQQEQQQHQPYQQQQPQQPQQQQQQQQHELPQQQPWEGQHVEQASMKGQASDDTSAASSAASQASSPADAPLLSLAVPPPRPQQQQQSAAPDSGVAGFHQPTVATELAGCTADAGSCCWGMLNCKDGTILL